MTGDLAVVAHHKTRMSSGRKHVQSQTFPFGNRGSAGVILVVGHALDERPEISLNLRHFLRPNSLAQINILHPGRRAETKVRPASEKRDTFRRLAWGDSSARCATASSILCGRKRLHAKLFLRLEVFKLPTVYILPLASSGLSNGVSVM
jgi:hypothetical protein